MVKKAHNSQRDREPVGNRIKTMTSEENAYLLAQNLLKKFQP